MSRFGVLGPQLHRAGWDVIPIAAGTKRPTLKGWQHGLTEEQIQECAANGFASGSVGLLAKRFPGVDIDVLDEQCAAAVEQLAREFLGDAPVRVGTWPKRLLMYATEQPFTKVKVFLEGPLGRKGPDGKDFAVEVLGSGQQYLIYGRHPDGHEYEWRDGPGPGDELDVWDLPTIDAKRVSEFIDRLPDALPAGWKIVSEGGGGGGAVSVGDAFANLKAPLEGWDAERVRQDIAPHLDLEMSYDDWVRVGQMLHHQFEGRDEGFDLWDEMFQGSSKYSGPDYGRERWKSFHSVRGGSGVVTLASLVMQTKAAREASRDATVKSLLDEIAAVSEAAQLETVVAPKVAKLKSLLDTEREQLALAVQSRGKDLGLPLSIGVVRGWLRYRPKGLASGGPDWAKDWVYLVGGDRFFNLRSKAEVTVTGFRAMFNRFMPMDRDGNREKADQAALEQWGMPVAFHKAYMPGLDEVFEMFGRRWVNLYRPESAPITPKEAGREMTQEELQAVEVVEQHFVAMFEDERERRLLLSWIAHNVQKVGVKIRWAPYVHGVPGDGKSFFADLLASAIGGQNVSPLNAKVLESSFNEWAIGAAVVAIEEMKQHGHSRYDVMNGVKPLITNDTVNIHPKGKAAYSAPNVTNYIVFSNYLDGAPVDETDRRYMFLSSGVTIEDARRMTAEGYYKRLFDAVRKHPGAMRQWLMGVSLDSEFDANGRAPDTRMRATVVEMSKTELDLAIEDLLENGADGVTKNVLSSSHFTAALKARGVQPPATRSLGPALGNLGFVFLGRTRWAGDMRNVWVRRSVKMKKEQAIFVLNQSRGESDFLG